MKSVYPYYSFLYDVDPEATSLHIAGFWNKHIRNWSNLLFSRHGSYGEWNRETAWEHEYLGGPLPIIANGSPSFINTGSDLIYAGALLAKFSGNSAPFLWAKRLLNRYGEIRNENTDLGGYQINHRNPCRVRRSFKKPLSDRQDLNETTVITNHVMKGRYGRAALAWLNLYAELGHADGQIFLDFARRDLTALGKYAYDFSDHSFSPVLFDGTKLSPSDVIEGVGYCSPNKLEKVPASGLMFLVYARAYRITGDSFFWKITRSLAQGLGWREIFDATDEQSANLRIDLSENNRIQLPRIEGATLSQDYACALFGLLELYKATDQKEYLDLAMDLGKQSIQMYSKDGFFTTGMEASRGYTGIDNSLPLALLHLAAASAGTSAGFEFYLNTTYTRIFSPKVIIRRRKQT